MSRRSKYENVKRAIALRLEGKSSDEIAGEMGMSRFTISRYLYDEGLGGNRKTSHKRSNTCDNCGHGRRGEALEVFRGRTLCRECLCPSSEVSISDAVRTASENLNCLRGAI